MYSHFSWAVLMLPLHIYVSFSRFNWKLLICWRTELTLSQPHIPLCGAAAEMVSNVTLLITVVFGGVLSVGGGVWERLHSAIVMISTSPEPVCYNAGQQRFT